MSKPHHPLLHPIALASIALLIVNDHLLKVYVPNAVTGKLSDVAGLVFFPLLVWSVLAKRALGLWVVATGVGFAAIKMWEPATGACEYVLALLQWPLTQSLVPVEIVRDPTDLLALPALALAWWIGRPTPASPGPWEGLCKRSQALTAEIP
jgi:hypothetical protein